MGLFRSKKDAPEDIEGARRLIAEDATALGAELDRPEIDTSALSAEGHDHLRQASLGQAQAAREVEALETADDVQAVQAVLVQARYHLACARALAADAPVPEPVEECRFNPQHGPSSRRLAYTFPRAGTQKVPVCEECARRIEAREDPELRRVPHGERSVPWFSAGAGYAAYLFRYVGPEVADPSAVAGRSPGGIHAAPSQGGFSIDGSTDDSGSA